MTTVIAVIGMVWSLTFRVVTGTGRHVRSMHVIDLLTYTLSIPGALRAVAIILVVTPMADAEAWFGRILSSTCIVSTTVSANVVGLFQRLPAHFAHTFTEMFRKYGVRPIKFVRTQ